MTLSAYAPTDPPALSQAAEQLLHASPYFYLRRLRCNAVGRTLFLRGAVPTQRLADIAEAIVSRVDGVDSVINCLDVAQGTMRPSSVVRTERIAG
jgi:osmotically-inducible protein OsmY